jgi:hypothetical protein
VNERFVANNSSEKLGFLTLLALLFVALGIWLVVDPTSTSRIASPTVIRGIGWFNIVFCGWRAVQLARLSFDSRPALEIDERGFIWRHWSDDLIPWSAVVRREQRSMGSQKFLCIWLDVPENHPSRSPLGKLFGLNKATGFGDISLSTKDTDQSFERLVEVVDAHLASRAHRVGTGSAPE